jgi:hypothetical protein
VAQDEPQVSFVGLLDWQFWDKSLGKILSIEEVHRGEEEILLGSAQLRCVEEKI